MMYSRQPRHQNTLFRERGWFNFADFQKKTLIKEIQNYPSEELLNISNDQLIEYFLSKYTMIVPTLDENNISSEVEDVKQDIRQDRRYNMFPVSGENSFRPATKITLEIPFEGDEVFFKIQPNVFSFSPPVGTIDKGKLFLSHQDINLDLYTAKIYFDRGIFEIKTNLQTLFGLANDFNTNLQTIIQNEISRRKQKLLGDRNLVANLGYKLKVRNNTDTTYASSQVRKKLPIQRPSVSSDFYQPEPVLTPEQYEDILKTTDNMGRVMELSPSVFKSIGEEAIRSHFLIQLNGRYEGQATGETFNYEGKTDILIKDNGRNIFIAECKFWHGEKVFLETIDQLLGYLSWRDTKAAIFIFNRNKDFSNVLQKIKETTVKHPNCIKFIRERSETSYEYYFSHRDDPSREMKITIMAFDIPN